MHNSIEPNFIFIKTCIWLYIFSLDFKIRARQQRHHYFEPKCIGPLHGHKGHSVHSSMTICLEDTQNTDTVLSNRKIIVS